FSALVLLIGVAVLASDAQARSSSSSQSVPESSRDAFAHFVPQAGAPASGGTVSAGTKFTLDLKVNAGATRPSDNGVTAAQEYLLFTNSVLQVVAPSASC